MPNGYRIKPIKESSLTTPQRMTDAHTGTPLTKTEDIESYEIKEIPTEEFIEKCSKLEEVISEYESEIEKLEKETISKEEANQLIEELNNLLRKVMDFNKEKASSYISDATLNLLYSSNQTNLSGTDIGHI